jgi:hypothetical protein
VKDDCVRALAVDDPFHSEADREAGGKDAQLILVPQDETPEVTFLGDRSSTFGRYLQFGTPEFADGRLRVPVQSTQPTLGPLSLATGDVAAGDLWKCT